MKPLLISFVTTFCLLASPALAQFDAGLIPTQANSSFINSEQGVVLQPTFPQPGEEVVATLNSYESRNMGATVSWYFDGQLITEATNQREATFTAGPAGQAQTLEVILTRPGGGREVFQSTITPVYLDIIVEPQTRVPNFYLGRALPSIGSIVNATALINGKGGTGFKNTDLVYTWRLNQRVLEGGPLRGRNTISFPTPIGNHMVLSLEVAELNGKVIARRSLELPSVEPEIHFYGVNSLYGTHETVVGDTFPLIGKSAVVRAEPYYLDSRTYNNPDVSEWEINRRPAPTGGGNPYEVTLERTGVSGRTTLTFHVRDLSQVLQGAQNSTQIAF